jgi:hypothetical protein
VSGGTESNLPLVLDLLPTYQRLEQIGIRRGSNASSALIIQIIYILQLDSSVTGSLPTGSVVILIESYFPIT